MSKCQDNSTTVWAKIVRANKNRLKYNFLTVCMVRLLWGTRYSCRGEVTFPSRLSFASSCPGGKHPWYSYGTILLQMSTAVPSSCPGGTPLIFLWYRIATKEHCSTIILSGGNTPDIPTVQYCYKWALQYCIPSSSLRNLYISRRYFGCIRSCWLLG